MIHLEKADNEGSKLYYSRKKIDTGAAVAIPDCETAVLGLNLAISPAYSGLSVLRWAAIWDGTSL